MFKGLMKKIFLTLLVLTCLTHHSSAENISDIRTRQIESGLYSLFYHLSQSQAVDNDMVLFFGWMPEEKQAMKEAAEHAIKELTRLRANLMSVGMPRELAGIKNELMDVLEKQKDIYRGVERRTGDQIHASYADFQEVFNVYFEHHIQKLDEYLTMKPMPDDFDVIQEELKLFSDVKDRMAFEQADNLLKNGQFKASYDILAGLRDKYKNTPAEGSILMRMSDCILHFDSDLPKELATQENGLNLLNEILDKRVYYPVLYDTFYRWRTIEQSYNHGMSNWSEIPNLEYNDKRMDIVRVIEQYLVNHPKDNWAKEQVVSLLTLANIVRGDPYGNSNLRYMTFLYMNLDDLHENDEAKEETAELVNVPEEK